MLDNDSNIHVINSNLKISYSTFDLFILKQVETLTKKGTYFLKT